jgi:hypothetical protein
MNRKMNNNKPNIATHKPVRCSIKIIKPYKYVVIWDHNQNIEYALSWRYVVPPKTIHDEYIFVDRVYAQTRGIRTKNRNKPLRAKDLEC